MKNKPIRYDVYSKKDVWMGSYSTQLRTDTMPAAFDMARLNWKQSGGKVIVVYDSGLEEDITNKMVIKKAG